MSARLNALCSFRHSPHTYHLDSNYLLPTLKGALPSTAGCSTTRMPAALLRWIESPD